MSALPVTPSADWFAESTLSHAWLDYDASTLGDESKKGVDLRVRGRGAEMATIHGVTPIPLPFWVTDDEVLFRRGEKWFCFDASAGKERAVEVVREGDPQALVGPGVFMGGAVSMKADRIENENAGDVKSGKATGVTVTIEGEGGCEYIFAADEMSWEVDGEALEMKAGAGSLKLTSGGPLESAAFPQEPLAFKSARLRSRGGRATIDLEEVDQKGKFARIVKGDLTLEVPFRVPAPSK
jgi:hypothetical protein